MINMAAASLLSTNALDYCVILFVKKPFCATLLFRRGDSWRGLQWNMCWDTQAPLHLEPPPRLILFLRVFRGCFYTAILSQTLCGYAFKTHISSSPNRRDSFIIWNMKKMAHFQEVFEFITAWADCFDVFSQMLLCQTVVSSPAQAFFIEALLPAQNGHHQTHSYR